MADTTNISQPLGIDQAFFSSSRQQSQCDHGLQAQLQNLIVLALLQSTQLNSLSLNDFQKNRESPPSALLQDLSLFPRAPQTPDAACAYCRSAGTATHCPPSYQASAPSHSPAPYSPTQYGCHEPYVAIEAELPLKITQGYEASFNHDLLPVAAAATNNSPEDAIHPVANTMCRSTRGGDKTRANEPEQPALRTEEVTAGCPPPLGSVVVDGITYVPYTDLCGLVEPLPMKTCYARSADPRSDTRTSSNLPPLQSPSSFPTSRCTEQRQSDVHENHVLPQGEDTRPKQRRTSGRKRCDSGLTPAYEDTPIPHPKPYVCAVRALTDKESSFTLITAKCRRKPPAVTSPFASPNLFSVLQQAKARQYLPLAQRSKPSKGCHAAGSSPTERSRQARKKHPRQRHQTKGRRLCRSLPATLPRVRQVQPLGKAVYPWSPLLAATTSAAQREHKADSPLARTASEAPSEDDMPVLNASLTSRASSSKRTEQRSSSLDSERSATTGTPSLEPSTTSSNGTSTMPPLRGKFWRSDSSDIEATSQSESDPGTRGYRAFCQKTDVKEDLDWLLDHNPEHEAPRNTNIPAPARLSDEVLFSVSCTLYNSAEVRLSQRHFPCFGRAMRHLFQATPAGSHQFKGWDQFRLRRCPFTLHMPLTPFELRLPTWAYKFYVTFSTFFFLLLPCSAHSVAFPLGVKRWSFENCQGGNQVGHSIL